MSPEKILDNPYDFTGPQGATEDSRPISAGATCRFCGERGWIGHSIVHRADCTINKPWPRARKLGRKK